MAKRGKNDNIYRSSTDDDLTPKQKQEYVVCMGEIQEKLSAIKHHLDSEYDIQSAVKLIYGFFRDITESLINCLLIISNTQDRFTDLTKGTKEKIRILKRGQKIPFFIPVDFPTENHNIFRSIYDGKLYIECKSRVAVPYKRHLNEKKEDCLNLNGLESLYDISNKSQHPRRPFQEGINHNQYLKNAKKWHEKIENLIASHWVATEEDKKVYLYQHKSKEDGKSHFYTLEPQLPGSDWIYQPKT